MLAFVAITQASCAHQLVRSSPISAVEPSLVAERFLRAVNANDIQTMAHLFGTKDGSIVRKEKTDEVQKRMFILASLLHHDDYRIEGNQIVPGRLDDAIQLNVRMWFGQRQVVLPFVMVRSKRSGWLVEQIGVDRLTEGG
ncbi:MAG TPA: hypothetical protein VJ957_01340 [Longimicrobiales bacterium]|nr:hypothetical protein [Longimicrobiales bacterium]